MKPTRCIDPVMKCCQYCEYGSVHYPYYPNTADFATTCMYEFEKDEPTEDEVKEFEKECFKQEYMAYEQHYD